MDNILIRKLTNSFDIDEVMTLQDEVFAVLDNPDYFRKNTAEMFANSILGVNCFAFGAYETKDYLLKLIAVGIAYDATDTDEDLNHDLVLFGRTGTPGPAVNMNNIMVHPDYRGKGLQRQLLQKLHETLRDNGYEYAIATVHPDNIWSVNNLKAEKYAYDHEQEKYGGLKRTIYVKKL